MAATAFYCIPLIVCAVLAATLTETTSDNNNIGCIPSCKSEDISNTTQDKNNNIASSNPNKYNNSDNKKKSTRSDVSQLHSVDSDGNSNNLKKSNNNYVKGKFIRIHFGIVRTGNRSNSNDSKNNNNSNINKRFIRTHFGRKLENGNVDNSVRTSPNNDISKELIRFRPLSELKNRNKKDNYSNDKEIITQNSITVELFSNGSLNEMNGIIYINPSGSYKKDELFLTDCCEFLTNSDNISNNISKNSSDNNKGKFICVYDNNSNIPKYSEVDSNSGEKGWIFPFWHPKAFDDRNNTDIFKSNEEISDEKNDICIYDITFNENKSSDSSNIKANDEDKNNNSNGRKGWIAWSPNWLLFDDSKKTTDDISSKEGKINRIHSRLPFDKSNSSNIIESKSENSEDKKEFIRTDDSNNSSCKWKINWTDSRRISDDGNKTSSNIMKNSSMKSRSSARDFITISSCEKFRDTNSASNNTQRNIAVQLIGNISSSKMCGPVSISLDHSLCSKSISDIDNNNSKDKKTRIHNRWVIKIHKSNSILMSNNEAKNAKNYFIMIHSGSTCIGSKRNSSNGDNSIEFIRIYFARRFVTRHYSNTDFLKNNNKTQSSDQKKFIHIIFSENSSYNRNNTNNSNNNETNNDHNKEKSLCFQFGDKFEISGCSILRFNDENSNSDTKKYILIHLNNVRDNSSNKGGILNCTEEDKSDQKGRIICFPSWLFSGTNKSNSFEGNTVHEDAKNKHVYIHFWQRRDDSNKSSRSDILKSSNEEKNTDKEGKFINHRFILVIGNRNSSNFRRNNSEGENDKKKFIRINFGIIINRINNVGSTVLKANNKNDSKNSNKKWFAWSRSRYLFNDSNKTLKNSFQDDKSNAAKFISIHFLEKYSDSNNNINVKLLSSHSSVDINGFFSTDLNDRLCFNNSSRNNNEKKFLIYMCWANPCYNGSNAVKNQNEAYNGDKKKSTNSIFREFSSYSDNNSREALRKNNVGNNGNNNEKSLHIKFRMKLDDNKNNVIEFLKPSVNDSISDTKRKFMHIHFGSKYQKNNNSNVSVLKNSEDNTNKKPKLECTGRAHAIMRFCIGPELLKSLTV
ncbi:unnamed protein product [Gongylonema pulchrum]|uniref:Subtilisin n=1 Tax=Gongylonema pulchrum TaxID=637853 RepID=A0A183DSB6_9BILA|nr:unnamed protein product [Gongylonema pulchrum]